MHMKGFGSTLALAVTGLLIMASPALAQSGDDRARPGAGSDRGSAGSGSTASAGGASAGGSVSSGGAVGGGSAGTSSGGGSSTSSFEWPASSVGSVPVPAPERRVKHDKETPRRASADVASTVTRRTSDASHTVNGEAPTWSRPRGDRPATDIAVTRVGPPPSRDSDERKRHAVPNVLCSSYVGCVDVGPGTPSLPPYYLYGVSLFWYDIGWGASPWIVPDVIDSRSDDGPEQGSLKLKVEPRHAKVYVDGYYVGSVDDFDGAFQKLRLTGGRHTVEIRAEGFETITLDVRITSEKTVTFTEKMKKLQ